MNIVLVDEDAEIEPAPVSGGGGKAQPELDRLSNILNSFNEQFGTLFTDVDRVAKRLKVIRNKEHTRQKPVYPSTSSGRTDSGLITALFSVRGEPVEP